jgi:Zinc finger, C3HC4 type (RING finger)
MISNDGTNDTKHPSSTTTITPPIWLNTDCHTQSVLTCNICCEVPFDPVVTPCDHVFCRTCIQQSLRRRKCCPNDRTPIRSNQLQNINGPLKRIWAQTPVKCPECQTWTGTLQSYQTDHGKVCINPQKRIKELEEMLKEAEAKLHSTKVDMEAKIRDLECKHFNENGESNIQW